MKRSIIGGNGESYIVKDFYFTRWRARLYYLGLFEAPTQPNSRVFRSHLLGRICVPLRPRYKPCARSRLPQRDAASFGRTQADMPRRNWRFALLRAVSRFVCVGRGRRAGEGRVGMGRARWPLSIWRSIYHPYYLHHVCESGLTGFPTSLQVHSDFLQIGKQVPSK